MITSKYSLVVKVAGSDFNGLQSMSDFSVREKNMYYSTIIRFSKKEI